MIISVCIPCMNRTYDLKETMPYIIKAANYSPPVEIVVLDYNSQDDLAEYIKSVRKVTELSYFKYIGRDYYHMAHARNLTILSSKGEWIVNFSTDLIPCEQYFETIRKIIQQDNYLWLRHNNQFIGVIAIKRDEFIDAGGYDERFEFYGKEDKDLIARLERRGSKFTFITSNLKIISTPNTEKTKNYRLKLSRWRMGKISKSIYEDNISNNVLVANLGKEWGQWQI